MEQPPTEQESFKAESSQTNVALIREGVVALVVFDEGTLTVVVEHNKQIPWAHV